jgi:tetratricopeptide (TPR) repeat protein
MRSLKRNFQKNFVRQISKVFIVTTLSIPLLTAATASAAPARKARPAAAPRAASPLKQQVNQALALARSGQYEQASNALFQLARRAELQAERPQLKYVLGLMLMEMKLNQVAAFQFVDVIRMGNNKYVKLAIQKLSVVADNLGDDTLLNYAVSKVDLNDFPSQNKDMLYFRIGEIKMKARDFKNAFELFSKVSSNSRYYNQALFQKGLAQLEMNEVDTALQTFQTLLGNRDNAPVTDTNRVSAQIAIARALYQKQDWDGAIEAYAQVPRDHFLWHDALFESSWAMMRAARFRSVLSNFHSLHSAYYEDFYIPESLLLRAIVYLYICKYDEMEKVLSLFESTYGPIRARIGDFIRANNDGMEYFVEIEKGQKVKRGEKTATLRLPYNVVKNISEQGNVKRSLYYVKRLADEKGRIDANPGYRATPVGQYALKVINNRQRNAKLSVGDMVKAHLLNMRVELRDLYEQAGFIRYEMINGKKESLKTKLAGKDLPVEQIDEKIDRTFYVQNGYEYYPFQGEYWLDEIGNYHYLGKQSCE